MRFSLASLESVGHHAIKDAPKQCLTCDELPRQRVLTIQVRNTFAERESRVPDLPAKFAETIMVIVMSMSAGREIETYENERYDDEVLNAGWLPPGLIPQLEEVVEAKPSPRLPPPEDIDAFLQAIYRNQE